jgi:hypothetical protein
MTRSNNILISMPMLPESQLPKIDITEEMNVVSGAQITKEIQIGVYD